jgi:hypothetical protein
MSAEQKINLDRLDELGPLARGGHDPGHTACIMEAAAYVAGEVWSDAPACVCPAIADFARNLNDYMPDNLRDELLRPLIPIVVQTKGTRNDELRRSFIAVDFAVRHAAALAMRAAGADDIADELAALPPIDNVEAAGAAKEMMGTAAAIVDERINSMSADAASRAAMSASDAAAWMVLGRMSDAVISASNTADNAAEAFAYAGGYRTPAYESAADCLRRMCESRS